MSDKVPENVIQDFWTDYPIIFYGKDTKNSTPDETFDMVSSWEFYNTPMTTKGSMKRSIACLKKAADVF